MGGIAKGVGQLIGGLFGFDEPTPIAPPVVEPPPVMPTPDDEAAEKARRRSIAKSMARRGRQSTILTDPVTGGEASDALGG